MREGERRREMVRKGGRLWEMLLRREEHLFHIFGHPRRWWEKAGEGGRLWEMLLTCSISLGTPGRPRRSTRLLEMPMSSWTIA